MVTINYRLGVFANAYFEGETLENPEWPTGANYQILDILAALKWLRANIGFFGGDPNHITVFGQSAGGNLGVNLLTTNGTDDLVSGVISESGTALITVGYLNVSQANSNGKKLISHAGCSSAENATEQLDCMRKLDPKTLLALPAKAGGVNVGLNVIDGLLLPEYPWYAMRKGKFAKVPVMIGNNEPDNFPACAEVPHINASKAVPLIKHYMYKRGVPDEDLSSVVEKYKLSECTVGQCCHVMTHIMLDYSMICNARRVLNATSFQDPTSSKFWYRFFCSPRCPSGSGNLCQHTAELEYVFGTVSNYQSKQQPNCSWNTTVRYFSDAVISQWTSFAAHGRTRNPWSPWTPNDSTFTAIVEPTVPNNIFFPTDFSGQEYCDMWDEIDRKSAEERFGGP